VCSDGLSVLVCIERLQGSLVVLLLNQWWKETIRFLDPTDSACRETFGSSILVSDCQIGLEGDREVSFLEIQD
jgi:hypothetical protein